jgi:hypothetical protein
MFLDIGLTQLSGQNGQNGNGAVTGFSETIWLIEQPVYCNGVQIDNLLGSGTIHYTEHWKDGVNIITICRYDLVYKSTETDEEFKTLCSNEKDFMIPEFVAEWHYNIIGNKGSHYIGTMSQNVVTGKYTIDRAVCLENGPKK